MRARAALRSCALATGLALSACEVAGGLWGDRHLKPIGADSAGCTSDNGCDASASAGNAGRGGAGTNEVSAGSAGDFESGGASDAGASGASGDAGAKAFDNPSCDGIESCNGDSPCTTERVPGGTFKMGRGNTGPDAFLGDPSEQPEHPVTLSPFFLDKYEVTVARFRRFVDDYGAQSKPVFDSGAQPQVSSSGWKHEFDQFLPLDRADLQARLIENDECNSNFRTWTPTAGNAECLPMNCVDWYVSFAFCIWDGGRLPSEAEWEFAAVGGDQNRLFPWGSAAPDNQHAVFACTAEGTATCSPSDIRPVGSNGPTGHGRWGHADLAGSMGERTRDVYDGNFYSENQSMLPNVINVSFDATEANGVIRGGTYMATGAALRGAARTSLKRSLHDDAIGWRCARNVE